MQKLDGQTILVIGANGFLGSHLLSRLGRVSVHLHAVSRNAKAEPGPVRWWQGSAADASWIRELVGRVKPDVIYQLASASEGGQDPRFVLPAFENDLQTTVNTLMAARDAGCGRVITTGSLDEPLSNGKPGSPSSPYAAAKAAARLYARMFHQLYSVPVVILRPFMTYGPGQKSHKVIPYTIQSMLQGKAPSLGSGARSVDWIYVDDVITAFVEAAARPEAAGMEIDLGSGHLVTIREVVEQIRQLIPGAPEAEFGSLPDRSREQIRVADLATAKEVLGWGPTTSLRNGLEQTIEWYRTRN